ncbi:Abortive infection protein [Caldicellulosiruptor acetigenus I77R1B]|uniref:Abortive infection protein n=1 Tax=Caldicellulosiruptor acetigenus (strain ATCC 700853 / DSM 12137 / I77R1B) TaxID=632335 RepID=E4S4T2_CALA7|nr:type II CAAX endopeptidase family protein [Caldicellulosiruptor acetigenus]ADQ41432.1 Abortive infection protein [Caldicellulosiruptor acetigenus I77R1B]
MIRTVKSYRIRKYISLFFISNFIMFLLIEALTPKSLITKIVVSSDIVTGILIILFCKRELREILKEANARHKNFLFLSMFIFGICYSMAMISLFTLTGMDKINIEHGEISYEIAKFVYDHRLLGFITICVIAPIIEEILFRGLIFRGLLYKNNLITAVFISSAIFALLHFNLKQAIMAFGEGVFASLIYFYYGSIFLPIAIHIGHNFASLSIAFLFGTNLNKYFALVILLVSVCVTVINIVVIKRFEKKRLEVS